MSVKVKYYNSKGEQQDKITLSGPIFESELNESSLYYAIKGYLSHIRQSNAKVKDRSEVDGSGRKPWRQKGTGRARHGSKRSPLWVGGGVTFGPGQANYNLKVNKKVKRKALFTAMSKRVLDGRLIILDRMEFEQPSTKLFTLTLTTIGIYGKGILLLWNGGDENFYKSCRNIPGLDILEANRANAYGILQKDWLIITKDALGTITEVFK
ncbi:50S ribosomal protein L4 [candidate division WOR-3 bacterium]|nr:50S ribosomal protein L4 [candidate division WOR-3 bacterium]MCK4421867.1 50S ribosomal protein L4 [candidate division WOR-3 bacterium]MCK4526826.1 50S ribosomal protein L4 [candidate division WOR-3 bacterium]